MSALDDELQFMICMKSERAEDFSAELVQLRAELATARKLIDRQANGFYATYSDRVDDLRAWLAAHPAPEAERTIIDAFADGM